MKKIIFYFSLLTAIAWWAVLTLPAKAAVSATDVFLTWSTDNYAPYSYLGKKLPAHDQPVFVNINPASNAAANNLAELNYEWFINDQRVEVAQNIGKISHIFRASLFSGQYNIVRVEISDQKQTSSFELEVYIPVVWPQVVIFPAAQNRPADETSIATSLMPGEQKDFIALPYFFSITSPQEISYSWNFEGYTFSQTEKIGQFSVKIPAADAVETFSRELVVDVSNNASLSQQARGIINLFISSDKNALNQLSNNQ